jgi:hypothetical protein
LVAIRPRRPTANATIFLMDIPPACGPSQDEHFVSLGKLGSVDWLI